MNNASTLARRLHQARLCGLPSMMIYGMHTLVNQATASGDSKPLLPIALGALLRVEDAPRFETWIDAGARVFIAKALAAAWARNNNIQTSDLLTARTMVEMMGTALVKESTSYDHMMRARARILTILRNSCPPATEVTTLLSKLIAQCQKEPQHGVIKYEQARQHIPGLAAGVNVSAQTYRFYVNKGHTLPSTCFVNPLAAQKWIDLADVTNDYVELNDIELNVDHIVQVYNADWRNMHDSMILGYYEAHAAVRQPEVKKWCVASTLVCITSLVLNKM